MCMRCWSTVALIIVAMATTPRIALTSGRGGQRGGGQAAVGRPVVSQPARSQAPAPHLVGGPRGPHGLPRLAKPMSLMIAPDAPGMTYSRWPFFLYGGVGFCSLNDNLFWGARSLGVVPAASDGLGLVTPSTLETVPTGGLQLDVDPRRADVYVDGTYVGIVDAFSGYYHHLDLAGGPHRIVILTHGYEPLIIDVVISPGRTTTYRGTLTYSPH